MSVPDLAPEWAKRYRAGNLTPGERRVWPLIDAAYTAELGEHWWRTSGDRKFFANVAALAAFKAEHKRWPSCSSADEDEQNLGRFLRNARWSAHTNDNGRLGPERRTAIDLECPGWLRATSDERFSIQIDALSSFVGTRDRFPRRSECDERGVRVGVFLSVAREMAHGRRGGLSDERRKALDSSVPGWDFGASTDDRFLSKVKSLSAFYEANRRWPNPRGSLRGEATLGAFLENARRSARGRSSAIKLDSTRLIILDRLCPDWRGVSADEKFLANATALDNFTRNSGRLPRRTASDPSERALGNFLNNVRQAARGHGSSSVSHERYSILDEQCPTWRPARAQGDNR